VSRPTQWLEGDTPPCLTTGRSALRPGLPRSGPARLRRGRYRNTLSGTEARHDVPDAGRLAMEHVGADPQAPAAQPQAPGRGRGSTGRTRRGARSGSRASRHEARGPERPSAGVPGDTGVRGRYPNGGARPRKHPSLIVIADTPRAHAGAAAHISRCELVPDGQSLHANATILPRWTVHAEARLTP